MGDHSEGMGHSRLQKLAALDIEHSLQASHLRAQLVHELTEEVKTVGGGVRDRWRRPLNLEAVAEVPNDPNRALELVLILAG